MLDRSENIMKKFIVCLAVATTLISGCSREANVASRNLSVAADSFEIQRRVVFYDSIQGKYLLSIEGLCSVESTATELEVTCKVGATEYKKHFLGISDNVTWFAEQLNPSKQSVYHYRVIFRPETILPDVDLQTSVGG